MSVLEWYPITHCSCTFRTAYKVCRWFCHVSSRDMVSNWSLSQTVPRLENVCSIGTFRSTGTAHYAALLYKVQSRKARESSVPDGGKQSQAITTSPTYPRLTGVSDSIQQHT